MQTAQETSRAFDAATFYGSYPEIFSRFQGLSKENGIPVSSMISAFSGLNAGRYGLKNPYIQNNRVKKISSLPENFTKDKVAEMLTNPYANEKSLRQVAHALEYTAYPLFHIRKTYQNILTYHNYIAPCYTEESDIGTDAFWREWKLLDKFRRKMEMGQQMHRVAGQVIQEGKVFYHPRYSVDKSHSKINHAFMQQLPSDWTKIVGFNNISKYTLAFNMMYFTQPGCVPEQFGDLFKPFYDTFRQTLDEPSGLGKSLVYAQKNIDMGRFSAMQSAGVFGADVPDVYSQNGRWFYWVNLPVDEVFTFEADDSVPTAISPLAGLYLSMVNLAAYEETQLSIVQNPLLVLFTGEIPYRDTKDATADDQYRMSSAGRMLFEALFDEKMAMGNMSGISMYSAPFEKITMHQLAEAPSATKISSAGYTYTMGKAGLTGLIPPTDDVKLGVANISYEIESRYLQEVYGGFERMMRAIIDKLNLRFEWRFVAFGSLATDAKEREEVRKDMTYGILPATLRYLALNDMSIFDDMCISDAVMKSKLLDKRMPLVTSYSAKNENGNLPPEVKKDLDPGGRPSTGAEGDGSEASSDIYGGTNPED